MNEKRTCSTSRKLANRVPPNHLRGENIPNIMNVEGKAPTIKRLTLFRLALGPIFKDKHKLDLYR